MKKLSGQQISHILYLVIPYIWYNKKLNQASKYIGKMKRTERTKNRKVNKFRYVVIVVCLAVFIYSAWHVGSNYYRAFKSQQAANAEAEKIQQQLEEARRRAEEEARANSENTENTENTDPVEEGDGDDYTYVLSLDELMAINGDIVGWLTVEGTNINYPVLYSYEDRGYYLDHNYLCEYDPQGAVFIENFNSRDLSDFNTIFYGHSMLNGNMFGTLHNFSHWDFFNSFGNIYFYTANATYYYQVFETATIDSRHIFTYLDNGNYESRAAYIDTIGSYTNGFIKEGYNITPEDHIITLSTCTTDEASRLVVFAVLTGVYYD